MEITAKCHEPPALALGAEGPGTAADSDPDATARQPHDPDIAHQVLRTIRQIVRRISAHSKQMSTEFGLTVPQLMVLKAIGELEEADAGAIAVADVGKRVQLSPATVSRIVDRLVRMELVRRERGEKDRRKVCLSLTESGLERFQSLPTPLQEDFVERLRALKSEERLLLLASLKRLASLMDADAIDAAPMLHHDEAWRSEDDLE